MISNFPYAEPVVVRDHELRVIRRFPPGGEIRARAGERVQADTVIGRTDPRSIAVRIAVADHFDVAPADAARLLMKPVGSTFTAGQPLARMRRGMRSVVIAAPVAGTLIEFDNELGVALIVPAGAGEMQALVPGDVERIEGKETVAIRTVGSRAMGIVGVGGTAEGPLRLLVERADQELPLARITPELAGTIVVGGSHASAAAIKRLVEVGIAGLVVGGLVERELVGLFGGPVEDRLGPWRAMTGGRVLGDGLPVPFALVATEGFGAIPMNPLIFGLLKEGAGERCVLLTGTRVAGILYRPEIVIPNPRAIDDDAPTSRAALVPGAAVRLVDQVGLGKSATVVGEPRRERIGDGQFTDLIDVELMTGSRRSVRVANLEILA